MLCALRCAAPFGMQSEQPNACAKDRGYLPRGKDGRLEDTQEIPLYAAFCTRIIVWMRHSAPNRTKGAGGNITGDGTLR